MRFAKPADAHLASVVKFVQTSLILRGELFPEKDIKELMMIKFKILVKLDFVQYNIMVLHIMYVQSKACTY